MNVRVLIASVAWTSAMFYMLYSSRARSADKLFVVEEADGLLLEVALLLSVLFSPSAQDFSCPVTAFTLSVLLLFSRIARCGRHCHL